jgi:hypothetical protein
MGHGWPDTPDAMELAPVPYGELSISRAFVSLSFALVRRAVPRLIGAGLGYRRSVRQIMVEYVGDVAIYTSSNALSAYYEVRKAILDGAENMLTSILKHGESRFIDAPLAD